MSSVAIPSAVTTVAELARQPEVEDAFAYFTAHAEAITKEHIAICEVPAPPFGEAERARHLQKRFTELGWQQTEIDSEGNCLAYRRGRSEQPLMVVSAHLDTVFSSEVDFRVRREGQKLFAPGISDDGCGLAALLALASVLSPGKLDTEGSLLLVGTVGEEGEGNLRGVKYLMRESQWAGRISAFISLDGPGLDRITNRALGSRRYRVLVKGSGGHSWADFGIPNPVHALGRAVAKLSSYPAPKEPRTTFNVGRFSGGASVNAIPVEASMDVDLRSASEDELLRLDAFFRRTTREAVEEENGARRKGTQPVSLELKLIGERPGGETPAEDPLVKIAIEATTHLGTTPRLDQASTDSNIPISLGVPAITIGAGGASGKSHTLEEWYDTRGRELGVRRALLIILAMLGLNRSG